MSKQFTGWLIKKQYYKVNVEADSLEQAEDMIWEHNVNFSKPDDYDDEVYDVQEITE